LMTFRKPAYTNTKWACDHCKREFTGPSWHCESCAFDLCGRCWECGPTPEAEPVRPSPDKKRQDSLSQSVKPKRSRPLVDVGSLSSSIASMPGGIIMDPMVVNRMEELETKTQDIEEFRRILGDAPRRLELLPTEQRRLFMNRVADTCQRMFVHSRADAGGA